MNITVELSAEAMRYLSERVAAGEWPTVDVALNALIEAQMARDSRHEAWFRRKVAVGLSAADAGDFASDSQLDVVLSRWP